MDNLGKKITAYLIALSVAGTPAALAADKLQRGRTLGKGNVGVSAEYSHEEFDKELKGASATVNGVAVPCDVNVENANATYDSVKEAMFANIGYAPFGWLELAVKLGTVKTKLNSSDKRATQDTNFESDSDFAYGFRVKTSFPLGRKGLYAGLDASITKGKHEGMTLINAPNVAKANMDWTNTEAGIELGKIIESNLGKFIPFLAAKYFKNKEDVDVYNPSNTIRTNSKFEGKGFFYGVGVDASFYKKDKGFIKKLGIGISIFGGNETKVTGNGYLSF